MSPPSRPAPGHVTFTRCRNKPVGSPMRVLSKEARSMASAPSNASTEQRILTTPARAGASRRPQPLIDALVPDAHLNAAVAGIRGLGLGGMRVMALGPSWTSPGLWSRHAAGRAVGPSVVSAPAALADRIARAGGRPWAAGRLPEPRGDDRPDAVRLRMGRRGAALPRGRGASAGARQVRAGANGRGGGPEDPRRALPGHRGRACAATASGGRWW